MSCNCNRKTCGTPQQPLYNDLSIGYIHKKDNCDCNDYNKIIFVDKNHLYPNEGIYLETIDNKVILNMTLYPNEFYYSVDLFDRYIECDYIRLDFKKSTNVKELNVYNLLISCKDNHKPILIKQDFNLIGCKSNINKSEHIIDAIQYNKYQIDDDIYEISVNLSTETIKFIHDDKYMKLLEEYNILLDGKQNKTDDNLKTNNKNITDAINELLTNITNINISGKGIIQFDTYEDLERNEIFSTDVIYVVKNDNSLYRWDNDQALVQIYSNKIIIVERIEYLLDKTFDDYGFYTVIQKRGGMLNNNIYLLKVSNNGEEIKLTLLNETGWAEVINEDEYKHFVWHNYLEEESDLLNSVDKNIINNINKLCTDVLSMSDDIGRLNEQDNTINTKLINHNKKIEVLEKYGYPIKNHIPEVTDDPTYGEVSLDSNCFNIIVIEGILNLGIHFKTHKENVSNEYYFRIDNSGNGSLSIIFNNATIYWHDDNPPIIKPYGIYEISIIDNFGCWIWYEPNNEE